MSMHSGDRDVDMHAFGVSSAEMRAVDEAQRVWQAQEVQLRHERDTAILNAAAAEVAKSDADARCLLAEAKCKATSEDLESRCVGGTELIN